MSVVTTGTAGGTTIVSTDEIETSDQSIRERGLCRPSPSEHRLFTFAKPLKFRFIDRTPAACSGELISLPWRRELYVIFED